MIQQTLIQVYGWWVREWWEPLLSWFYPPANRCLSCTTPLSDLIMLPLSSWFPNSPEVSAFQFSSSDSIPAICLQCASIVYPHDDKICTVCGRSLSGDFHHRICSDCQLNPPLFETARSFGDFRNLLQEWVARYKFGRELELEPLLGHLLGLAYWEYYRDLPVDLIVPVPLHPIRLQQRGFNQAEKIAQYLVPLACAPCKCVLSRVNFTGSQTSKSRQGRVRTQTANYEVPGEHRHEIENRCILLVDDVYTTGTTARLCADALLKVGAASVVVLTLGR